MFKGVMRLPIDFRRRIVIGSDHHSLNRGTNMTGTVSHLLIGMVVFIVSHIAMSSLPVRTPIIQKIGE